MKPAPCLLVVTALAALLAGCAPKKVPKPETGVASGEKTTPLPVIGPAPVWQLKDLDGNVVRSDQFKGKVVIVDFWATWCPPCREEIPGYVALYRKYGPGQLAIIGVSVDEAGVPVVKRFVDELRVNYPVVMADDRVIADFGNPDGFPATFLIDRNGMIRDKKVGADPAGEFERKVTALLN
jgi:thiol-disulfide isomerase/thioredoxin